MSHTWLISQFYFSLGKEESNQRICSFHFTHFGNTRHTCIHYSMALDWTKWAVGMPVPSLTDTGHVKFQTKQPRVCLQPIWGGSGIESLSVSDAASSWCTWKAEGSSSWARDTHGGHLHGVPGSGFTWPRHLGNKPANGTLLSHLFCLFVLLYLWNKQKSINILKNAICLYMEKVLRCLPTWGSTPV